MNALREANALAEAATRSMSRFVAIVSHEIRTPLNALLNSLSLLAESGMAAAQHRCSTWRASPATRCRR
jgi:signal transduction histidine kinase